ncbi:MAG: SCO family protein [Pseudomonadota bacterium]
MGNRLSLLTVIAIAAVAMLAGALAQRTLERPAASESNFDAATVIPEPLSLPTFELSGVDGPITNTYFAGRWTVVFFGFSNCPDICPTTLATLASMAAEVRSSVPEVSVMFVSVDPERDTPDDADRYARFFDASFIGVTGSDAALRALTEPLGVLYIRVPQGDDGYTVDHTSSLLLINPDGQLSAVFSAPHDEAAIAADITALATAY